MPLTINHLDSNSRLSIGPEIDLQNGLVLFFQLFGLGLATLVFLSLAPSSTRIAILLFASIPFYFWARFWFGRDVVTVTKSSLVIASSLFGFVFSTSEYENSTVRRLRYEEWSGGRSGRQNAIRFESDGLTITFARQAGSSKAWELIDRMRQEYPFVDDPTSTDPV
jgi:hypothetical protein